MKKVICWIFGHDPVIDYQAMRIRECHCSRCNQKMIGAYMKGELTGEHFWVYIIDKH